MGRIITYSSQFIGISSLAPYLQLECKRVYKEMSMVKEAPHLETERLILRHFTLDDFPGLAACWADPEMVKFIGGGQPQGQEMTWSRLLRYIGHWQALGYGYWGVFEKVEGRFVGAFGFQDARRELTPALQFPEAGWTLIPAVHGKGYANEALGAILGWADGEFTTPVCCIIDNDNHRSIHLAEGFGFQFAHYVEYHGKQVKMFIRPTR